MVMLKSITHPALLSRLVSQSTFLEEEAALSGKFYDKLVVGVGVINPLAPNEVLVVQRAAEERFLPGVYELPGGHVENSDRTILDAVVRETLEETGLEITEIVGEFAPFEYTVSKTSAAEPGAIPRTITKSTIQLNFMAKAAPAGSVNPLEVKLNPLEHQNYAWVSKGDLAGYNFTEGMRKVVMDALLWAEEHANGKRHTDLPGLVTGGVITEEN